MKNKLHWTTNLVSIKTKKYSASIKSLPKSLSSMRSSKKLEESWWKMFWKATTEPFSPTGKLAQEKHTP